MLLRLIQLLICKGDHLLDICRDIRSELCDSKGDFHQERLSGFLVKSVAGQLYSLAEGFSKISFLALQHDNILITTYAPQNIIASKTALQYLCHTFQGKIPSRMSPGIINLLQVIQITIDHVSPLTIASLADSPGMLHEASQIQKSCQLVILRNNTKDTVSLLNLLHISGHFQTAGSLGLTDLQIAQGQTDLQTYYIEEREILLIDITGQKSVLLLT